MNEYKKKVLVIGPSPDKSRGGMATVIDGIRNDITLNSEFDIDIYESYIDGNVVKRVLFSILAIVKFYYTGRNYDIYHLHVASYGSTYRKNLYSKIIKKWNKKVILHIHGGGFIDFYNKEKNKQKMIWNFVRSADCVIALSSHWKEIYDRYFGINNCVVIENAVDTDELFAAYNENYSRNFIVLARMNKNKGTYDLIDAIDNIKDKIERFHFFFAGDGEIDNVRTVIRERKLEQYIDVVGWVGRKERIELLKKCSVLVLPSYHEALPMCILEGMASGKYIISTRIGAIPEVVSEKNGILIDPGDIDALGNAIIECNNLKDSYSIFSRNNREKIIEKYSTLSMHQKLKEIYGNVL